MGRIRGCKWNDLDRKQALAVVEYVRQRDRSAGPSGNEDEEDLEDIDADLQVSEQYLKIKARLAHEDLKTRARREKEVLANIDESKLDDPDVKEVYRGDRSDS